jgi:hypothetical protein
MVRLVMAEGKDPNESQRHSIAGGLCMMALGLGLVLNDGLPLFSLWPFVPLALGTAHLTRPDLSDDGHRSLRAGLWWMFVGAWGLGNTYRVLGMQYRDTWPALVIVAGVMLVWESVASVARQESRP